MLYSDGLKAIRIVDETAKLVNNGLSESHQEAMQEMPMHVTIFSHLPKIKPINPVSIVPI